MRLMTILPGIYLEEFSLSEDFSSLYDEKSTS